MKALAVIGAQKAGTATLMADLSTCRGLWVDVSRKEESPLIELAGRRLRRWFEQGGPERVAVDVSTRYTMMPAERVALERVLAGVPELKVVYIVRDPLHRTLSHWRHDELLGLASGAPAQGVTMCSPYVLNSLYGAQLTPWVASLGVDRVLPVRFEDYVRDRRATVEAICRFAGASAEGAERIDVGRADNVTAARARYPSWVLGVARTRAYHLFVRRTVPRSVRERAKRRAARPNPTVPSTLPADLERGLRVLYAEDNRTLRALHADAPTWSWMNAASTAASQRMSP